MSHIDARSGVSETLSIETADCGVAALQALSTTEIDILLVDLHMPDLTGLDVIRFWRSRSQTRAGLALVVSALISDGDRARATTAGASGFLEKPIRTDALREHLWRHLEGAR